MEVEQLAHAAALGDALGVAAAAELTGWSRTRIGDAQRSQRSSRTTEVAAYAEDAS